MRPLPEAAEGQKMIIYLYGDNSYAINGQLRKIRDGYTKKTGQDADMQTIDLSEKSVDYLLSNLAAMPMFVSSRLIIVPDVSGSGLSPEDVDKIEKIIPDSTNLVLTDVGPDKRKSVYKKLSVLKGAKEFAELNLRQLHAWVKSEANELGGSITDKDIDYLINYVGENQWGLHNELRKLVSYDKKITKDSIDKLSVQSLENSAFELAEALVKKNLKKSMELYKSLVEQGNADLMILGAITYQYRSLLLAHMSDTDLNKVYKISPYALQKARGLLSGLTLDDIKDGYKYITKTDLAIKTGELKPENAMRRLISQLCT